MKKLLILMFLAVSITSFSQITIEIKEPIRFKKAEHINVTGLNSDEVAGMGTLLVTADDPEHDIGKKLTLVFPEYGLMTNMKRWIRIKKYDMANDDKSFEIKKEHTEIRFYAVIDKTELTKGDLASVIEGEYISYVPIIVRQFSKKFNGTSADNNNTENDAGDIPTPLPEIYDN